MNKPVMALAPEIEIAAPHVLQAISADLAREGIEPLVTRTCHRCGETKPVDLMKRDARNSSGLSSFCKVCHGAATVAWQKANPERVNAVRRVRNKRDSVKISAQRKARYSAESKRDANRLRLYRITPERYAEMIADQAGCCALCRRPAAAFARPLAVDHDHACCTTAPTCGQCTRGLLCGPCNLALHSVETVPGWVSSAVDYLENRK